MNAKVLTCGSLSACFDDGGLRYIRYGGVELIRGIYAAVRNRNWDTVKSHVSLKSWIEGESGCSVHFQAVHQHEEVDFVWDGTIEMTDDSLQFTFDGVARNTFLKNRIGFCVLHPMHFSGMPIDVQTPSGMLKGTFPEEISPHQPVQDITGMAYDAEPGIRVSLHFAGDLFEMEDQRNWTDASYKTYCTPLELPFPVEIKAGERIKQSITMEVHSHAPPLSEDADDTIIHVTDEMNGRMPKLGTVFTSSAYKTSEVREKLEKLNLSHYHVTLHLHDSGWRATLIDATKWANYTDSGLEIELVADEGCEQFKPLLDLIKDINSPVQRIMVYPKHEYVTTQDILHRLKQHLTEARMDIPTGGGTRAYFAEFNRADLPIAAMDLASYTINPQVHAFDDHSVMETLQAQPVTALNALRISSGKPLCIGPITMKPRFNPNATSGGQIPIQDQVDVRLREPFGAAWLIGSISALAIEGVHALTYFTTVGPLGLLSEDGKAHPVFRALAEIMEVRDAYVGKTFSNSPGEVCALVLCNEEMTKTIVTNLTPDKKTIRLQFPGFRRSVTLPPYGYKSLFFKAREFVCRNSDDL